MHKENELTEYDYLNADTKHQMNGLKYFAEKFADPDFELGHFQATPVVKNGPRKPHFILGDIANDFVTFCINEKLVDLRIDADTELNIGKSLFGNNPIEHASPYELVVLLTYILGNLTYWQSRLINSFQSGLLQRILDRGAELSGNEEIAA